MAILGSNLSLPAVAVQGGGGGAAPPPTPQYAAGLVQHLGVASKTIGGGASLRRSTAWTGQGPGLATQFTLATAFIYLPDPDAQNFYRSSNGRNWHYVNSGGNIVGRGRDATNVTIWQTSTSLITSTASADASGTPYLYVISVDTGQTEANGLRVLLVNLETGSVAARPVASSWPTPGTTWEVAIQPYGIWSHDNGTTSVWSSQSVYQAVWYGSFADVEANADAFYNSAQTGIAALKDPLNDEITSLLGTPQYCLDGDASQYNSGVNRANLAEPIEVNFTGAGRFTDYRSILEIPSIVAHWDGMDTGSVITATGVSDWFDQLAALDFKQALAASQPGYTRPYAGLDGTDDNMTVDPFGTNMVDVFDGGGTLFMVMRRTAIQNGEIYSARVGPAGEGWHLLTSSSTAAGSQLFFGRTFSTSDGQWATEGRDLTDTTFAIYQIEYDGSSAANDVIFKKNGAVLASSETSLPIGTPTSDAGNSQYLGSSSIPNSWKPFDVADIVFFDSILGASDEQTVLNYLSDKHGITLP